VHELAVGRSALALCGVLAACGDNQAPSTDAPLDGPDASIDASIRGPCWPVDTSTPGGDVELGTGYDAYRPMPDVLHLVYGDQGGYHIEARSRVHGMVAGDPANILNPINPRSRFRAFFMDTGEPINPTVCPVRLAYLPAADGDGLVLAASIEIRFDTSLTTDQIFDKQYRVIVEVIDADGKYAMAEKVITAVAP